MPPNLPICIALPANLDDADYRLLRSILKDANLHGSADAVEVWNVGDPTRLLRGRVVLAFGSKAASAALSGTKLHIEQQRGFVFENKSLGAIVVPTQSLRIIRSVWVPWRPLASRDIKRVQRIAESGQFVRPIRTITFADELPVAELERTCKYLTNCDQLVSADIEIFSDQGLACVGFAASAHEAIVFGPQNFREAFQILRDRAAGFVWANGQFDLYFLLTRCGVTTRLAEDTQLAWHACFPELAGASIDTDGDKSKSKTTRKSLSFLSSIFTYDRYWKDYEFQTEQERWTLNGRDCCITLDIMQQLLPITKSMNVTKIYELEKRLVPVCVDVQRRGFVVDDKLRRNMIEELQKEVDKCETKLQTLILPLVEKHSERIPAVSQHLFETTWTCPCCNGGKAKRKHCWACAGFTSNPTKRDLIAAGYSGSKKLVDLREEIPPCKVCAGDGKRVEVSYSATSHHQRKILFYNILQLPVRRNRDGTVRSDAAVTAELRKHATDPEVAEIIDGLLDIQKLVTMIGIYKRIRPGDDGRIRTNLNPAGTDTGRFSSSNTFLDRSTNLQNLPKRAAFDDSRFEVRNCLIPESNRVLFEVDYSSAERRLLAYLANETRAIEQIETGVNAYKWFAGQIYEIDDYAAIPKGEIEYQVGKTAVLALDRGVGWKTLQETADVTAKESKRIHALFHQMYPGYTKYFDQIRSTIRSQGYLVNVAGRRRDFFGRRGSDYAIQQVVRDGVSFMAQAVGDVINEALADLYERDDPDLLHILLQVHDAIVGDCHPRDLTRALRATVDLMERPITMPNGTQIIIPAEPSFGPTSWGQMQEVSV